MTPDHNDIDKTLTRYFEKVTNERTENGWVSFEYIATRFVRRPAEQHKSGDWLKTFPSDEKSISCSQLLVADVMAWVRGNTLALPLQIHLKENTPG